VPLVQGVMRSPGYSTAAANYAVSKDGTLVYMSGTQAAAARQLVWVDTEGRETPVPTPARAYNQVVLSPDGTHAALGIAGDDAVWLSDLSRGTLERLPEDLGDQEPSLLFFSVDGRRVASSAIRDGQTAVVWQTIDGTSAAEPLVTFDASVTAVPAGALSPDGKQFVATVAHSGNPDLGVATVGDAKSYRDFLATPAAEITVAISPDGHWITYASNETGDYQVYVQRFPEGGGRRAASINGGGFPHWSADGNALTYMGLGQLTPVGIMRAPVTGLGGPDGSPTFGTPEELFPWKYFFATNGNPRFDMTADGERFLMITAESQDSESARVVVVTNWVEELKRAVPTE
jgi:hypothetical protein